MAFCTECGKQIDDSVVFCDNCGAKQELPGTGLNTSQHKTGKTRSPVPPPSGNTKSQTVATILCALFGWLGVHRFYLGPIWLGVLYLLFSCTLIPALVAFIETFVIAFSSQQSWARKYNNGEITPPAHIVVKILAIFVPLFSIVFMVGILAAVSLPLYNEYQQKAKAQAVLQALQSGKTTLTEFLGHKKNAPLDQEVLKEIQSVVGRDPNVVEVDAFAYGNYGDIGAKLNLGGREGMLYLVTQDGGQTWKCQAVNLQQAMPRNCEPIVAIERPEIPKPNAKVGQWDEAFYQGALNACTQRAQENGDATGPEACRCILDKAAQDIPQDQAERADMPFKQSLHQYAVDCRMQMSSKEDSSGQEGNASAGKEGQQQ